MGRHRNEPQEEDQGSGIPDTHEKDQQFLTLM